MKDSSIKLSVIVPVYNGEKYIDDCLSRLKKISGIKHEIIVVNDGSTDRTDEILKKHRDVKVIKNEKNKGVSHTRNEGMKLALGKYIAFVDVDDCFDETMYKRLVNMAEKEDLDVSMGDYYEVFGNKTVNSKYQYKNEIMVGEEVLRLYLLDKVSNNIWDKIFKKDLVEGLSFDTNLAIGEDILFCLQAFIRAKKVGFVKEAWYGYMQTKGSAMHSKTDKFKQYNQVVEKLPNKERQLLEEKYYDEMQFFEIEMKTRTIHAISMANASRRNRKKNLKDFIKNIDISGITKDKRLSKSTRMEMFLLDKFGPSFHIAMMPLYKLARRILR